MFRTATHLLHAFISCDGSSLWKPFFEFIDIQFQLSGFEDHCAPKARATATTRQRTENDGIPTAAQRLMGIREQRVLLRFDRFWLFRQLWHQRIDCECDADHDRPVFLVPVKHEDHRDAIDNRKRRNRSSDFGRDSRTRNYQWKNLQRLCTNITIIWWRKGSWFFIYRSRSATKTTPYIAYNPALSPPTIANTINPPQPVTSQSMHQAKSN